MSPAHSSASNSVVERRVQTDQGKVRVLRRAVEEWRGKLGMAHNIKPWLVEYASPYERLLGLAFGEKILWRRRAVSGNSSKLTDG